MPSFPSMSDLPPVLSTKGWTWAQLQEDGHEAHGFWLGTDVCGQRWLTKLRGSFYAYREITFAKLAQHLGWSCQSSTYIELDSTSAALLRQRSGELHAAHWYMDEHPSSTCCDKCPMRELFGREIKSVEDLEDIKIAHIMDWPKSELAAYIFGANEPSGRLITEQHEFVIIDNEQMFSSGPSEFHSAHWIRRGVVGSALEKGLKLAHETCAEVASISAAQLAQALAFPRGVKVDQRWSIKSYLEKSIAFASQYA